MPCTKLQSLQQTGTSYRPHLWLRISSAAARRPNLASFPVTRENDRRCPWERESPFLTAPLVPDKKKKAWRWKKGQSALWTGIQRRLFKNDCRRFNDCPQSLCGFASFGGVPL